MEIRRKVKNVVYKYSEPEKLVREATSNDPWGPTSTLMSEIADLTSDYVAFEEMMPILWKRLNDKGKNWRHVYKCLVLLDYLIKCGDKRIVTTCLENIHAIETLKDFQYFEEYKDLGLGVRDKSKILVSLLRNDEELEVERQKSLTVKEKFQSSNSSMGSYKQRRPGDLGKEIRKQYDKDIRNPKSVMQLNFDERKQEDEDDDLKMAIELSKEEHEKAIKQKQEEEVIENIKIKMALEKSKKEEEALSALRPPPRTNEPSMTLDLLTMSTDDHRPLKIMQQSHEQSRVLTEMNGLGVVESSDRCDPWATTSINRTEDNITLDFDPWKNNNQSAVLSSNDWTSQRTVSTNKMIEDIFGDEKPSIQFEPSWSSDSHEPSPDKSAEKYRNNITSSWTNEPVSDKFHSPKMATGSFPSLSDIDVGHHDDGLRHSSSAMTLSSQPPTRKSPHDFLGDNAKLVNLENLLPSPTAGVYWDSTSSNVQKNPFGSQIGSNINPFHNTAQSRKPMNSMTNPSLQANNQSLLTSGNTTTSNINNNYNLFAQMPQAQYQTAHINNNGPTAWTQHTQAHHNYWPTNPNNAPLNPFI